MSDLNTALLVLAVIGLVALAYVAGLATRPLGRLVAERTRRRVSSSRADQRLLLEDLPRLLPELQKAAEAASDDDAFRRYVALDQRLSESRNRIANPRLRDQIRRYQQRVALLAHFHYEDAARPPLLDASGDVDGAAAMGRVHAVLTARKDAYVGLSRAMTGISEEIRRL